MSSPSPSPIALFFGAGARVGAAVTSTFLAANYRVAAIAADLSDPGSVERVFATVRSTWGEPSVVIYNAYGSHSTGLKSPANTFEVSTAAFAQDQAVNTTSAFVAIRETLASFHSPASSPGPKTFIFTGNLLNQGPLPGLLTLGVGKTATAHMVELADSVYGRDSNEPIRFFYADERHFDVTPLFVGLGAQGHADTFLGLATREEGGGWSQLPWLVTFVSGAMEQGRETGSKEFPKGLILPEELPS